MKGKTTGLFPGARQDLQNKKGAPAIKQDAPHYKQSITLNDPLLQNQ